MPRLRFLTLHLPQLKAYVAQNTPKVCNLLHTSPKPVLRRFLAQPKLEPVSTPWRVVCVAVDAVHWCSCFVNARIRQNGSLLAPRCMSLNDDAPERRGFNGHFTHSPTTSITPRLTLSRAVNHWAAHSHSCTSDTAASNNTSIGLVACRPHCDTGVSHIGRLLPSLALHSGSRPPGIS